MSRMVYYDQQGNEVDPPEAEPIPSTNADRIRAMTDEELADFLCYWDNCGSTEGLGYNTEKVGDYWLCKAPGGGDIIGECQVCALAWLKSPADKEEVDE